ncbi:MAG: enoyl-CoA hydratase/isomerase family protein [Chloroflexi bacterium]|nr:enoyl-CoA hydratase/isomerase family protein [Chloroflexota bacterium]
MIGEDNRKSLRKPEELKYVDYECKNGVAWIKFNEPDRRNPLSLYRVEDIREAVLIAEDDDDAVIICFAAPGGPHFSGGAEIKPWRWGNGVDFFHSHRYFKQPMWEKLFDCKKPTVAALHGYTIGFCLETMLRCDIIIAAEDTMIGELEIQFSSPYGNQKIARLANERIQMWYSYTGDLMNAQEALHWGIVNKVVPTDKLDEAIYDFCNKLSRWSPTALWFNRLAIKYGMTTNERTGVLIEDLFETLQSTTPDWAQGLLAFQSEPRRMPVFTNKLPKARVPDITLMPDTKKPIIDTKQMSYIFEPEEPNIGEEGQWFGEKGRDEDSRPKKK